jgi:lysophospholipase L1-like esterase
MKPDRQRSHDTPAISDKLGRWLLRGCLWVAALSATGLVLKVVPPGNGMLVFLEKVLLLAGALGAVVLWLGFRFFGEQRTAKAGANTVMLVLSLGIGLLVSEFGARLIFADITTTAEGLSWWTTRWNKSQVRRNHLGFREREVSGAEHPGRFRIAMIGDSFTFGQGIPDTARYSTLVERALNGDSSDVFEVLNFGRSGAETVHELKILDQDVVPVAPDFVLLQWYINDVEGDDKSARPHPRALVPSPFLRSFLRQSSALYYLLEKNWNSLQERLGWTESYETYLIRRFSDSANPSSRQAAAALAEFVQRSRNRGIPTGIVIFGQHNPDGSVVRSLGFLPDRVVAFCSASRTPCLDLRSSFVAHGSPDYSLCVNRFDCHPSAKANRIAAEEIMKIFGPHWHELALGQRRAEGATAHSSTLGGGRSH